MSCPHIDAIGPQLRPPTLSQSVYREDCTQCFDSIDDPDGLFVCLQCFNGGCAGANHHAKLHLERRNHPLALNIKRTRKTVVRDEPPAKMSKLAIAAETEEDRYETAYFVRCLDCGIDVDKSDARIAPVVQGILSANAFSRQEEVKAWEQEFTTCEHILLMQQEPSRVIQSGDLGHCSGCDLKENLWLCLECGNLGCGRQQLGGAPGNGHGLQHTTESGHGVAVKLGSITPEGTADIYCYKCDMERIDDKLADHLAHWGILLAEREKTEKSLTEMQIEQNLKWDFSMSTGDGQEMVPLFGPGLTGLKNLGNSCYLASVIQCLFDLPSFQERYYSTDSPPPVVNDPATDLETQLRKIADGLLSGRYSKPDPSVSVSEHSSQPFQKGLAPAMLKHLIGRGHEEFSTMRQQDAFELLQYFFSQITRSAKASGTPDPTAAFRFVLEQRLQCLGCKKVRYTSNEQDNVMVDFPDSVMPTAESTGNPPTTEEGEKAPAKSVTLEECLDRFTSAEKVELTCSACGSRDGFTKRTLFKTFPDVLTVNAKRMAQIGWVPIKLDIPVIVPSGPFDLDKYLSPGHQEGEEVLPEDAKEAPPAFVPNEAALEQLMEMGFSRNRCEHALHATGNSDPNAAMEYVFGHMDDASHELPLELPGGSGGGTGNSDVESPEKIEMLGAMGFDEPRARKALRETGGDAERAVDWLFSHPDDPGLSSSDAEPANDAAPTEGATLPGNAILPAKFQLESIVCHKGTSIHAGHYVAFIRKTLQGKPSWVLFNDEKVVEATDFEEMAKFAYIYLFKRV